jgi:hypothetical protein
VSDPKRNEGDYNARTDWGNAVPQHTDPGANLSDLFPPAIVDNKITADRDRPKA